MNRVMAARADSSVGGETKRNQELPKLLNFSGNKPTTPILDTVNYPIHMKNLSIQV